MTSNFEHRLSTIAFDKVINDLTAEFVGRDWLFEKIHAWLEGPQVRCLLLIGEPGVGKSAIAARLIKSRRDVVAHHFCIAGRNDTILPTHVLLSIAAQLMTRVPGYAEALANVVRPLHLTVQVKINAESLLDGHVQGVVINHLYASNSAEILDLVLRQPFQFCKPMEPITIVIDSLDEAATLTGGENLLSLMVGLATLPECVRLVMTTRRDETRVMPYLTHLSPAIIEIPTRTAEAEQDIADYARLRLGSPEVRDALQLQAGDPIDGVTAKVVKLAEGNFLYTRVLFDELSAKHVTLDDLDTLPSEIDELYKRFLTRLLPEWHQGYQTILTILAVAVEPIAEADLTALTDDLMGETELRRKLGVLRQFLDETIPFKGAPSRFTLFHNSLQNYLTDQARAQQFWCSAREGNRLITGVCWRHHPNRWRTCSVYGLRNCARHLYVLTQLETNPNRIEQASERLHDLFAGKTDSAENSWLDAKSRLGDLAGYIADLELARRAAQNIFQEDRPRSLGLQCRYALFLSTLASVARNITPNLLVRLTRDGLCTPEQAIAYADSAPGGDSRAELLAALVPVLGETHTDQVLGRLLRMPLRDIGTALSTIVACPSLSETWLHRIWDVVQQGGVGVETATKLALRLPSVAGAAFALAAKETNPNFVGPYLDRSIREWMGTWPVETLEFFRAIQKEEIRSDVISRLGPHIPSDIQDPTIDLAFAIKDKRQRAIALTGVAGFLKGHQIELALKAVMENGDPYSRARVLLDLTSSIPGALDSAEKAVLEWLGLPGMDDQVARLLKLRPGLSARIHQTAMKWDDAHQRAEILIVVMPYRPEAAPDALDAIAAVDDADNRLDKLSRIWPVLPSALWTRALALIGPWQGSWQHEDSRQRAKAVSELSPHCPPEHYPAVFSLIRSIASPTYRAQAASSFALQVSSDASVKFVHEVFDDIEKHAADEANAFAGLAPVLPQAAWRTLELAPRLSTEYERSRIIEQILPALSKEMLEKAFRCVQLHYDFPEQAAALDVLSQFDGTFTDWSIECAKSILKEYKRAAALTHLLPRHPELGDAAIAAVEVIPVAMVREEHLEKLVAKLSPSYWSEVQKIVEGFEGPERIEALTAIAKAWPGLGADSMLAAELSHVKEAGSPTLRDMSEDNVAATLHLIRCIEAGTAAVVAEALNMAMAIHVGDHRRAYALARLVPYLTDSQLDQVQKTLDALFEMPDALIDRSTRRELQVAVAVRRPDLRDRALDVVLAENPTRATYDLERLLPALSVQQLTRVADAVASGSARDPARAYGHLAPFLPGADALAVTAALESEPGERTKTLVWLSMKTPAAVPHAVRAARDHYELLSEIPNFETVAFAEAMDCIPKLEFGDERDRRAEAIEKLTPALLKLESGERHSQLQKILLVGARRERTEILKDLKALIPIIHSLGSGGAIREVGNAIRLVTGFWP